MSRSRLILIVLIGSLMAVRSEAQLAPTGGHYAARPTDTGYEPGGPNALGTYTTSIPLNLPPARGGLPIPLQIVYGARGFGAAGLGWDVPLSYVRFDTSFAHRRPLGHSDTAPLPREHVVLSLLGQKSDMVRKGTDWVARQGAPDMTLRAVGLVWKVFDGHGRTYSFTPDPKLVGTGLTLLSSVTGPGGTSLLVTYDVGTLVLPGSPGPSIYIDLVKISYDPHPTQGCFKHELNLSYDAVSVQPPPLALSVMGERVITRLHKLSQIDVTSRASCGASPQRLRSYMLSYQADADTGQLRLSAVQMKGRQGSPEQNSFLPIVSYTYGRATHAGTNGPVLRYQKTQSIALPTGTSPYSIASTLRDTTVTAPIPGASWGYSSRQGLIDVTGDGRPDLVFAENNQLRMARNVPGVGGSTALNGPTAQLTDTTLVRGLVEMRSSAWQRFTGAPEGGAPNTDYVWRQAIDVNGDGRLDIIDASEEPKHWVVYLNIPDPGPSGVKWVRRSMLISPLYQHFKDRNLVVESDYLPLSKRFTGRDYAEWRCWRLVSGEYFSYPEGLNNGICHVDPNVHLPVRPEQTYTEWELRDINGDGYPDVLFNSAPVQFVSEGKPAVVPLSSEFLLGTESFQISPLRGGVEAVLNVRGLFLSDDTNASVLYPFSEPVTLLDHGSCGVGQWIDLSDHHREWQSVGCDFADVNGDGLLDRIEGTAAFLGTGVGFGTARVTLPGNLAVQKSGQPQTCGPGTSGNSFSFFTTTQRSGLRDLTGDGIPDFIAKDQYNDDAPWQVYVGTGAGFAPPIRIQGTFVLSQEDETCGGTVSNTTAGLYDIDGDGKPETVIFRGTSLDVYQLAGDITPRTPEAGRLTQVASGYGAVTKMAYRSAKEDRLTLHQVPFPEIVVSSIETTGTQGLGGSLSATRYAYGGAELFYDSSRDAFSLPEYHRSVALRLMPSEKGGDTTAAATITDTYPLEPWSQAMDKNARLGRYLRAGQTRDVTVLGSAGTDPWALLSVDVTSDARRLGTAHYDWQTRTFAESSQATEVCPDIMYAYDFDLAVAMNFGPQSYDACTAHGFLYPAAVYSWRGSVAPPSDQNVEVRTTVLKVDDVGRVEKIQHENDVNRSDDDLCVDTVYAQPAGASERVLSAPASRTVWNCSAERPTTYAVQSFVYDGLPAGSVSTGFVTAQSVERHATDSGEMLGVSGEITIQHDSFGNPTEIVRKRDDGATLVSTFGFDPFGLVPVSSKTQATGAATLAVKVSVDPVSLDVLKSKDANGTEQVSTFDGFGRPLLSIVKPPGGTEGVLSSQTYLGFAGGDPLGRRIVVTEFTDPVAPSAVTSAVGRTSTTFLDELGRQRYTLFALGGDYGNQSLVTDARTYDRLGRVVFEAEPFSTSDDFATAYGTTRYFAADGSPRCFVQGRGLQPFTTVPNNSIESYPTLFTHTFGDHQEALSMQDATSLLPGSPQSGVFQITVSSAVGRPLFRSTWKSGTRLEHEAFAQDHLGQLIQLVRYQDAANGTNPVQWSWRVDSLGQVLQLTEPDSAPQTRTYSTWGELLEVRSTPPSPAPPRSTTFKYDALSRLTHSEEQNGGATDEETRYDYEYDVGKPAPSEVTSAFTLGRMTRAIGPRGDIFFSYNALGQAVARTFTGDNGAWYLEQHTFHGDGSEGALELVLPDTDYQTERVDYVYDSAGRPRSLWFSDGSSTQSLYKAVSVDAVGHLLSADFGKTHYTASYNPLGRRLLRDVHVSSALGARAIAFPAYDPMGRELSRSEKGGSEGDFTYTYDPLGRVSTSSKTLGTGTLEKWSFAYDPLGNIVGLNDNLGAAGATLSYLATDRDRICRIGYGSGGLGGTDCNVGYDIFGNIASEPTRTGSRKLGYFNSGRVRTIEDSSSSRAELSYDAFGELQRLYVVGADIKQLDQHYGALIAQRYQASGSLVTSYLSRQFPAPGGTVSRRGPNGPWIFTFSDSRGMRVSTDEKGAFVQDVGYQPYGEATSTLAQMGTAQYSTEQWNGGDALSSFGLVQLGARVYDPVIGRFLSRDPVIIPRSAAATHPYAFAMNDPINASDPSGLDPCGGDPLCISTSSQGGEAGSIAAALGALWAITDYLTGGGTSGQHPAMGNESTQKAFQDAYHQRFDTLDGIQRVFNMAEPVTPLIMGTLRVACDFIACDQETGGGDTFVSDGHGGEQRDIHQPHRVSYSDQGVNVGKNVLIGKLVSSLLGGLGGRAAAQEEHFVYRGVHEGHPALEAALEGRVVPGNVAGVVTAEAHNAGGFAAESPFTSWTHEYDVALSHAIKKGPGGVILRVPTGAPPPGATWSWEWSPDIWLESEVLLRGTRDGAKVIRP